MSQNDSYNNQELNSLPQINDKPDQNSHQSNINPLWSQSGNNIDTFQHQHSQNTQFNSIDPFLPPQRHGNHDFDDEFDYFSGHDQTQMDIAQQDDQNQQNPNSLHQWFQPSELYTSQQLQGLTSQDGNTQYGNSNDLHSSGTTTPIKIKKPVRTQNFASNHPSIQEDNSDNLGLNTQQTLSTPTTNLNGNKKSQHGAHNITGGGTGVGKGYNQNDNGPNIQRSISTPKQSNFQATPGPRNQHYNTNTNTNNYNTTAITTDPYQTYNDNPYQNYHDGNFSLSQTHSAMEHHLTSQPQYRYHDRSSRIQNEITQIMDQSTQEFEDDIGTMPIGNSFDDQIDHINNNQGLHKSNTHSLGGFIHDEEISMAEQIRWEWMQVEKREWRQYQHQQHRRKQQAAFTKLGQEQDFDREDSNFDQYGNDNNNDNNDDNDDDDDGGMGIFGPMAGNFRSMISSQDSFSSGIGPSTGTSSRTISQFGSLGSSSDGYQVNTLPRRLDDGGKDIIETEKDASTSDVNISSLPSVTNQLLIPKQSSHPKPVLSTILTATPKKTTKDLYKRKESPIKVSYTPQTTGTTPNHPPGSESTVIIDEITHQIQGNIPSLRGDEYPQLSQFPTTTPQSSLAIGSEISNRRSTDDLDDDIDNIYGNLTSLSQDQSQRTSSTPTKISHQNSQNSLQINFSQNFNYINSPSKPERHRGDLSKGDDDDDDDNGDNDNGDSDTFFDIELPNPTVALQDYSRLASQVPYHFTRHSTQDRTQRDQLDFENMNTLGTPPQQQNYHPNPLEQQSYPNDNESTLKIDADFQDIHSHFSPRQSSSFRNKGDSMSQFSDFSPLYSQAQQEGSMSNPFLSQHSGSPGTKLGDNSTSNKSLGHLLQTTQNLGHISTQNLKGLRKQSTSQQFLSESNSPFLIDNEDESQFSFNPFGSQQNLSNNPFLSQLQQEPYYDNYNTSPSTSNIKHSTSQYGPSNGGDDDCDDHGGGSENIDQNLANTKNIHSQYHSDECYPVQGSSPNLEENISTIPRLSSQSKQDDYNEKLTSPPQQQRPHAQTQSLPHQIHSHLDYQSPPQQYSHQSPSISAGSSFSIFSSGKQILAENLQRSNITATTQQNNIFTSASRSFDRKSPQTPDQNNAETKPFSLFASGAEILKENRPSVQTKPLSIFSSAAAILNENKSYQPTSQQPIQPAKPTSSIFSSGADILKENTALPNDNHQRPSNPTNVSSLFASGAAILKENQGAPIPKENNPIAKEPPSSLFASGAAILKENEITSQRPAPSLFSTGTAILKENLVTDSAPTSSLFASGAAILKENKEAIPSMGSSLFSSGAAILRENKPTPTTTTTTTTTTTATTTTTTTTTLSKPSTFRQLNPPPPSEPTVAQQIYGQNKDDTRPKPTGGNLLGFTKESSDLPTKQQPKTVQVFPFSSPNPVGTQDRLMLSPGGTLTSPGGTIKSPNQLKSPTTGRKKFVQPFSLDAQGRPVMDLSLARAKLQEKLAKDQLISGRIDGSIELQNKQKGMVLIDKNQVFDVDWFPREVQSGYKGMSFVGGGVGNSGIIVFKRERSILKSLLTSGTSNGNPSMKLDTPRLDTLECVRITTTSHLTGHLKLSQVFPTETILQIAKKLVSHVVTASTTSTAHGQTGTQFPLFIINALNLHFVPGDQHIPTELIMKIIDQLSTSFDSLQATFDSPHSYSSITDDETKGIITDFSQGTVYESQLVQYKILLQQHQQMLFRKVLSYNDLVAFPLILASVQSSDHHPNRSLGNSFNGQSYQIIQEHDNNNTQIDKTDRIRDINSFPHTTDDHFYPHSTVDEPFSLNLASIIGLADQDGMTSLMKQRKSAQDNEAGSNSNIKPGGQHGALFSQQPRAMRFIEKFQAEQQGKKSAGDSREPKNVDGKANNTIIDDKNSSSINNTSLYNPKANIYQHSLLETWWKGNYLTMIELVAITPIFVPTRLFGSIYQPDPVFISSTNSTTPGGESTMNDENTDSSNQLKSSYRSPECPHQGARIGIDSLLKASGNSLPPFPLPIYHWFDGIVERMSQFVNRDIAPRHGTTKNKDDTITISETECDLLHVQLHKYALAVLQHLYLLSIVDLTSADRSSPLVDLFTHLISPSPYPNAIPSYQYHFVFTTYELPKPFLPLSSTPLLLTPIITLAPQHLIVSQTELTVLSGLSNFKSDTDSSLALDQSIVSRNLFYSLFPQHNHIPVVINPSNIRTNDTTLSLNLPPIQTKTIFSITNLNTRYHHTQQIHIKFTKLLQSQTTQFHHHQHLLEPFTLVENHTSETTTLTIFPIRSPQHPALNPILYLSPTHFMPLIIFSLKVCSQSHNYHFILTHLRLILSDITSEILHNHSKPSTFTFPTILNRFISRCNREFFNLERSPYDLLLQQDISPVYQHNIRVLSLSPPGAYFLQSAQPILVGGEAEWVDKTDTYTLTNTLTQAAAIAHKCDRQHEAMTWQDNTTERIGWSIRAILGLVQQGLMRAHPSQTQPTLSSPPFVQEMFEILSYSRFTALSSPHELDFHSPSNQSGPDNHTLPYLLTNLTHVIQFLESFPTQTITCFYSLVSLLLHFKAQIRIHISSLYAIYHLLYIYRVNVLHHIGTLSQPATMLLFDGEAIKSRSSPLSSSSINTPSNPGNITRNIYDLTGLCSESTFLSNSVHKSTINLSAQRPVVSDITPLVERGYVYASPTIVKLDSADIANGGILAPVQVYLFQTTDGHLSLPLFNDLLLRIQWVRTWLCYTAGMAYRLVRMISFIDEFLRIFCVHNDTALQVVTSLIDQKHSYWEHIRLKSRFYDEFCRQAILTRADTCTRLRLVGLSEGRSIYQQVEPIQPSHASTTSSSGPTISASFPFNHFHIPKVSDGTMNDNIGHTDSPFPVLLSDFTSSATATISAQHFSQQPTTTPLPINAPTSTLFPGTILRISSPRETVLQPIDWNQYASTSLTTQFAPGSINTFSTAPYFHSKAVTVSQLGSNLAFELSQAQPLSQKPTSSTITAGSASGRANQASLGSYPRPNNPPSNSKPHQNQNTASTSGSIFQSGSSSIFHSGSSSIFQNSASIPREPATVKSGLNNNPNNQSPLPPPPQFPDYNPSPGSPLNSNSGVQPQPNPQNQLSNKPDDALSSIQPKPSPWNFISPNVNPFKEGVSPCDNSFYHFADFYPQSYLSFSYAQYRSFLYDRVDIDGDNSNKSSIPAKENRQSSSARANTAITNHLISFLTDITDFCAQALPFVAQRSTPVAHIANTLCLEASFAVFAPKMVHYIATMVSSHNVASWAPLFNNTDFADELKNTPFDPYYSFDEDSHKKTSTQNKSNNGIGTKWNMAGKNRKDIAVVTAVGNGIVSSIGAKPTGFGNNKNKTGFVYKGGSKAKRSKDLSDVDYEDDDDDDDDTVGRNTDFKTEMGDEINCDDRHSTLSSDNHPPIDQNNQSPSMSVHQDQHDDQESIPDIVHANVYPNHIYYKIQSSYKLAASMAQNTIDTTTTLQSQLNTDVSTYFYSQEESVTRSKHGKTKKNMNTGSAVTTDLTQPNPKRHISKLLLCTPPQSTPTKSLSLPALPIPETVKPVLPPTNSTPLLEPITENYSRPVPYSNLGKSALQWILDVLSDQFVQMTISDRHTQSLGRSTDSGYINYLRDSRSTMGSNNQNGIGMRFWLEFNGLVDPEDPTNNLPITSNTRLILSPLHYFIQAINGLTNQPISLDNGNSSTTTTQLHKQTLTLLSNVISISNLFFTHLIDRPNHIHYNSRSKPSRPICQQIDHEQPAGKLYIPYSLIYNNVVYKPDVIKTSRNQGFLHSYNHLRQHHMYILQEQKKAAGLGHLSLRNDDDKKKKKSDELVQFDGASPLDFKPYVLSRIFDLKPYLPQKRPAWMTLAFGDDESEEEESEDTDQDSGPIIQSDGVNIYSPYRGSSKQQSSITWNNVPSVNLPIPVFNTITHSFFLQYNNTVPYLTYNFLSVQPETTRLSAVHNRINALLPPNSPKLKNYQRNINPHAPLLPSYRLGFSFLYTDLGKGMLSEETTSNHVYTRQANAIHPLGGAVSRARLIILSITPLSAPLYLNHLDQLLTTTAYDQVVDWIIANPAPVGPDGVQDEDPAFKTREVRMAMAVNLPPEVPELDSILDLIRDKEWSNGQVDNTNPLPIILDILTTFIGISYRPIVTPLFVPLDEEIVFKIGDVLDLLDVLPFGLKLPPSVTVPMLNHFNKGYFPDLNEPLPIHLKPNHGINNPQHDTLNQLPQRLQMLHPPPQPPLLYPSEHSYMVMPNDIGIEDMMTSLLSTSSNDQNPSLVAIFSKLREASKNLDGTGPNQFLINTMNSIISKSIQPRRINQTEAFSSPFHQGGNGNQNIMTISDLWSIATSTTTTNSNSNLTTTSPTAKTVAPTNNNLSPRYFFILNSHRLNAAYQRRFISFTSQYTAWVEQFGSNMLASLHNRFISSLLLSPELASTQFNSQLRETIGARHYVDRDGQGFYIKVGEDGEKIVENATPAPSIDNFAHFIPDSRQSTLFLSTFFSNVMPTNQRMQYYRAFYQKELYLLPTPLVLPTVPVTPSLFTLSLPPRLAPPSSSPHDLPQSINQLIVHRGGTSHHSIEERGELGINWPHFTHKLATQAVQSSSLSKNNPYPLHHQDFENQTKPSNGSISSSVSIPNHGSILQLGTYGLLIRPLTRVKVLGNLYVQNPRINQEGFTIRQSSNLRQASNLVNPITPGKVVSLAMGNSTSFNRMGMNKSINTQPPPPQTMIFDRLAPLQRVFYPFLPRLFSMLEQTQETFYPISHFINLPVWRYHYPRSQVVNTGPASSHPKIFLNSRSDQIPHSRHYGPYITPNYSSLLPQLPAQNLGDLKSPILPPLSFTTTPFISTHHITPIGHNYNHSSQSIHNQTHKQHLHNLSLPLDTLQLSQLYPYSNPTLALAPGSIFSTMGTIVSSATVNLTPPTDFQNQASLNNPLNKGDTITDQTLVKIITMSDGSSEYLHLIIPQSLSKFYLQFDPRTMRQVTQHPSILAHLLIPPSMSPAQHLTPLNNQQIRRQNPIPALNSTDSSQISQQSTPNLPVPQKIKGKFKSSIGSTPKRAKPSSTSPNLDVLMVTNTENVLINVNGNDQFNTIKSKTNGETNGEKQQPKSILKKVQSPTTTNSNHHNTVNFSDSTSSPCGAQKTVTIAFGENERKSTHPVAQGDHDRSIPSASKSPNFDTLAFEDHLDAIDTFTPMRDEQLSNSSHDKAPITALPTLPPDEPLYAPQFPQLSRSQLNSLSKDHNFSHMTLHNVMYTHSVENHHFCTVVPHSRFNQPNIQHIPIPTKSTAFLTSSNMVQDLFHMTHQPYNPFPVPPFFYDMTVGLKIYTPNNHRKPMLQDSTVQLQRPNILTPTPITGQSSTIVPLSDSSRIQPLSQTLFSILQAHRGVEHDMLLKQHMCFLTTSLFAVVDEFSQQSLPLLNYTIHRNERSTDIMNKIVQTMFHSVAKEQIGIEQYHQFQLTANSQNSESELKNQRQLPSIPTTFPILRAFFQQYQRYTIEYPRNIADLFNIRSKTDLQRVHHLPSTYLLATSPIPESVVILDSDLERWGRPTSTQAQQCSTGLKNLAPSTASQRYNPLLYLTQRSNYIDILPHIITPTLSPTLLTMFPTKEIKNNNNQLNHRIQPYLHYYPNQAITIPIVSSRTMFSSHYTIHLNPLVGPLLPTHQSGSPKSLSLYRTSSPQSAGRSHGPNAISSRVSRHNIDLNSIYHTDSDSTSHFTSTILSDQHLGGSSPLHYVNFGTAGGNPGSNFHPMSYGLDMDPLVHKFNQHESRALGGQSNIDYYPGITSLLSDSIHQLIARAGFASTTSSNSASSCLTQSPNNRDSLDRNDSLEPFTLLSSSLDIADPASNTNNSVYQFEHTSLLFPPTASILYPNLLAPMNLLRLLTILSASIRNGLFLPHPTLNNTTHFINQYRKLDHSSPSSMDGHFDDLQRDEFFYEPVPTFEFLEYQLLNGFQLTPHSEEFDMNHLFSSPNQPANMLLNTCCQDPATVRQFLERIQILNSQINSTHDVFALINEINIGLSPPSTETTQFQQQVKEVEFFSSVYPQNVPCGIHNHDIAGLYIGKPRDVQAGWEKLIDKASSISLIDVRQLDHLDYNDLGSSGGINQTNALYALATQKNLLDLNNLFPNQVSIATTSSGSDSIVICDSISHTCSDDDEEVVITSSRKKRRGNLDDYNITLTKAPSRQLSQSHFSSIPKHHDAGDSDLEITSTDYRASQSTPKTRSKHSQTTSKQRETPLKRHSLTTPNTKKAGVAQRQPLTRFISSAGKGVSKNNSTTRANKGNLSDTNVLIDDSDILDDEFDLDIVLDDNDDVSISDKRYLVNSEGGKTDDNHSVDFSDTLSRVSSPGKRKHSQLGTSPPSPSKLATSPLENSISNQFTSLIHQSIHITPTPQQLTMYHLLNQSIAVNRHILGSFHLDVVRQQQGNRHLFFANTMKSSSYAGQTPPTPPSPIQIFTTLCTRLLITILRFMTPDIAYYASMVTHQRTKQANDDQDTKQTGKTRYPAFDHPMFHQTTYCLLISPEQWVELSFLLRDLMTNRM